MENNQNPVQGGQSQAPIGQSFTPNQAQMPQQSIPMQSPQSITQQPQQIPQPPPPMQQKSSHIVKTLLIMVILSIVVILSILAYLSFVNNQSSNSSTIQIENTTTLPTSTPIQPSVEEEINSVNAGDVDADLKEVDVDLQTL